MATTRPDQPQFKVGQELDLVGYTCGCYAQHGERVSFRRYDVEGRAEVFTCRGSNLVKVADLSVPGNVR